MYVILQSSIGSSTCHPRRGSRLRLSPLGPSPLHIDAQLPPDTLLLGWRQGSREPTRARRNEHPRPRPLLAAVALIDGSKVLPLVLPPVLELRLRNRLPLPDPPHALPDALAHEAHHLGPTPPRLLLQHADALVHLLLAKLRAAPARPRHNVGQAQGILLGHALVLVAGDQARGDAAAVEELPEEVRGVGVGVAGLRGLDARSVRPRRWA
ncbi:hypothetical protein VUR80DRAFT_978 [Thermomyces stellatus]